MKHILNDLSESEKNSIREQYKGQLKVATEKFNRLLESKLGDVKPLLSEQSKIDPNNPSDNIPNTEKKTETQKDDSQELQNAIEAIISDKRLTHERIQDSLKDKFINKGLNLYEPKSMEVIYTLIIKDVIYDWKNLRVILKGNGLPVEEGDTFEIKCGKPDMYNLSYANPYSLEATYKNPDFVKAIQSLLCKRGQSPSGKLVPKTDFSSNQTPSTTA